jgi:isopropylmalate/homocitrate/citramalate synthase
MSDRLIIFDTTLRDGEQAPGIALSPEREGGRSPTNSPG